MNEIVDVNVNFRYIGGEMCALIVDLPGNMDCRTCLGYAHVGQHSAYSDSLLKEGSPGISSIYFMIHGTSVRPADAKDLYDEMTAMGYRINVLPGNLSDSDIAGWRKTRKESMKKNG